MKKRRDLDRISIVAGWMLGICTLALAAGVYLSLVLMGISFDTSASQPHSKLFAWGVHTTMIHSVRRRAPATVPRLPLDRATLDAGMRSYRTRCIACHGGPGIARARWASAMLPSPPYLIGASARWSHAELYHIVHDGVKMTGMPAWGEVLSDREVAETVALVEAMPKLTPSDFAALADRVSRAPAPSEYGLSREREQDARPAGSVGKRRSP